MSVFSAMPAGLGDHLLVGEVEEVDHPRRLDGDLAQRLGGADRLRLEEVSGVSQAAPRSRRRLVGPQSIDRHQPEVAAVEAREPRLTCCLEPSCSIDRRRAPAPPRSCSRARRRSPPHWSPMIARRRRSRSDRRRALARLAADHGLDQPIGCRSEPACSARPERGVRAADRVYARSARAPRAAPSLRRWRRERCRCRGVRKALRSPGRPAGLAWRRLGVIVARRHRIASRTRGSSRLHRPADSAPVARRVSRSSPGGLERSERVSGS